MMLVHGLANYMLLGALAMIIIAYLVSNDANSLGENGTMWFVIVLIFPMMGLFIYLALHGINRNSLRSRSLAYNSTHALHSTPLGPGIIDPSSSRYEERYPDTHYSESIRFRYCTNCGIKNTSAASVCKRCGATLI